jgi:putative tryptophan/tyrosine transport system substrate-binding protein
MRRREFITLLGGAAAAWPLVARAQQRPGIPVIGFLNTGSADSYPYLTAAFRQGLGEYGYVEGRNVAIEYRWADNRNERLPALAADLVQRQVSVIAATAGSVQFAKNATKTIPIVFNTAGDPVANGTVVSLNRPSGNVTGVTSLNSELGPKQLQLLKELLPTASIVAALINPNSPSIETWSRNVQAAANTLGLQVHILQATNDRDIDAAFATLLQLRAHGLVMASSPLFTGRIAQLATLTIRHAVPAIYGYSEFARAGGLMSYGASIAESYRLVGAYTGRILKGDKTLDLPVQQATKIEMVINMRTAKALGITFPITLLGRANEVIE